MRLPLSWLNEFVKVDDIEPKELAEKLTRAGLQVESVESVGGSDLSDLVVVAEVLASEAHPNSDHLHVCRVTDGKEEFQVVCGAPNVRAGIKTAFAKIGALIPEGGFKIKKGRLRGVDSFGMCCSEKELHIGAGEAGIVEFPPETPVGALVRDVAELEKPETVFDIEVTWNRPDALSVYGLAREFGAILRRPVTPPATDFTECGVDVVDEVKVTVDDPAGCPRYTARVVTEVEDGPSPALMAKRLELCGVRSLGLVVDVTNYVLLELGAPMHAFDHTRLKDRTIVVRRAAEGEKIKTLDGVERALDPSVLVICDSERPNAVAGVMGGEDSEIAEGTKTVMLESALFDPAVIKHSSSKLGLSSESSYRYIRGVDKAIADFASRRAAHLLQKYGAAKIAKGVVDVDNRPKTGPENPFRAVPGVDYSRNVPVSLDFDRARSLIGINIGNDAMVYILESLGLRTVSKCDHFASESRVVFAVPSWRWDLELEADLVEEVARIYGLDNIPDTMPSAPSVSPLSDAPFRAARRVRDLCTALGFSEAMHYSFLSAKELSDFDPREESAAARLVIPDPVSADYGVMRDSLLPQMYASLGRNASHQLDSAMLFEIGRVFSAGPKEKEMLALGFFGPVGREPLRRRAPVTEEEAVLWMKGAVGELAAKLHVGGLRFTPAEAPAFAKGAALGIELNGRRVGVMGAVSAKLRHPFRLTAQMALCEIELKGLLANFAAVGKVSPPPQFPSVRRDIALKVAKGVTNETIVKVIRKTGGRVLTKVELFDTFKESRAYSLEFRSADKTLTDDEVGAVFRRIVDALKTTDGVEVREN
ncbi:MAG: phenylalanine--tRNA ligase subunit beta [Kiritimatiellae bacterium]|nr:phenylalanine--tRNA ligase subunit beta [Kiritimatiellia bacterium]